MKPGLLAVVSLFAFTTSNALAHDGREGFGRVLFKTSCTPQAQKEFERALAQLHSFDFPETLKSFAAIPQTDPGCAISYWGLAVATRPNPLVGPWDAATLKRGLEAVEKGEAIGAKPSASATGWRRLRSSSGTSTRSTRARALGNKGRRWRR